MNEENQKKCVSFVLQQVVENKCEEFILFHLSSEFAPNFFQQLFEQIIGRVSQEVSSLNKESVNKLCSGLDWRQVDLLNKLVTQHPLVAATELKYKFSKVFNAESNQANSTTKLLLSLLTVSSPLFSSALRVVSQDFEEDQKSFETLVAAIEKCEDSVQWVEELVEKNFSSFNEFPQFFISIFQHLESTKNLSLLRLGTSILLKVCCSPIYLLISFQLTKKKDGEELLRFLLQLGRRSKLCSIDKVDWKFPSKFDFKRT